MATHKVLTTCTTTTTTQQEFQDIDRLNTTCRMEALHNH